MEVGITDAVLSKVRDPRFYAVGVILITTKCSYFSADFSR